MFDGVGEYDIPVIEPEDYHTVDWIGFNSAKTTKKRTGKGVHFFFRRLSIQTLMGLSGQIYQHAETIRLCYEPRF